MTKIDVDDLLHIDTLTTFSLYSYRQYNN